MNVNQYFMYGILVPYEWHVEWEEKTGKDFYETFYEFMHDNSFTTEVEHKEGIFCLFDGRDGRHIIIGRVLEKSCNDEPFLGNEKPIKVPELDDIEKMMIETNVERYFNLKGNFHYYFVTQFR
jgi:hypothetical protein